MSLTRFARREDFPDNETKRGAMRSDNDHEADAYDYLGQTDGQPAGDGKEATVFEDAREVANDITQCYLDAIGRLPILTAKE